MYYTGRAESMERDWPNTKPHWVGVGGQMHLPCPSLEEFTSPHPTKKAQAGSKAWSGPLKSQEWGLHRSLQTFELFKHCTSYRESSSAFSSSAVCLLECCFIHQITVKCFSTIVNSFAVTEQDENYLQNRQRHPCCCLSSFPPTWNHWGDTKA